MRAIALFAVRKVFFAGLWHLRCVNCSDAEAVDTLPFTNYSCYLDLTHTVLISCPPTSCETSWIPDGPLSIYGRDEVVSSLPTELRTNAIVAQRGLAVVTSDDMSEVVLPRFLLSQPSSVATCERVCEFSLPYLSDWPDVRSFEERMRESAAVSADLELFIPKRGTIALIPVGLFLPVTLRVPGSCSPGVMRVRTWLNNSQALVELWGTNSVVFDDRVEVVRSSAEDRDGLVICRVCDAIAAQ